MAPTMCSLLKDDVFSLSGIAIAHVLYRDSSATIVQVGAQGKRASVVASRKARYDVRPLRGQVAFECQCREQ
jgi:hypothetical protein